MNDVLTESVYVGFSADKSLVCCTIRNGLESFNYTVESWNVGRLRAALRDARTIPAKLRLLAYRELEQAEAEYEGYLVSIQDEPTVIDWPLVGLYGLAGVLFTSLTAWVVLNW